MSRSVILILLFLNSFISSAQNNCEIVWPLEPINTGSNATYLVNSLEIFENDQNLSSPKLGSFFTNINGELQCAGWMVVGEGSIQIPVWGDDTQTPEIDGFTEGEEIIILATFDDGTTTYQTSTGQYITGDVHYEANGINVVASLTILNTIYCENDADENPGCTDSDYIEYNPNASTDDGSCNELKISGCMDPLFVQYNPLANSDNGSCEVLIRDALSELINLYYSSDSIISELELYTESWNNSITLQEGWNIFGYGCPMPIDIVQGLSNHTDLIGIAKENNGAVYIPEYDYNGIGNLIPGYGYQINVVETIEVFRLCDWYIDNMSDYNINNIDLDLSSIQSDLDCYENPENCSNELGVLGCMDEFACNYNDQASTDDGSCTYPQIGYDCDGNITEYIVGMEAEGGIVFYVDEAGQHGLVAALEDLGEFQWGCYGEEVDGAEGTSIGTGYQNTMDIVNQGCTTEEGGITAAQAALDAEINGYSDWYLPSEDELFEMYNTIGPGGIVFYLEEIGPEPNVAGFLNDSRYWSSSEVNNNTAWSRYFGNGVGSNSVKYNSSIRVRVIRAFDYNQGCMDEAACNYNTEANIADGSCEYAEEGFECFQITQGNIHQRVANWISNPDSVEAIYGHISSWDVSNVTDMSHLFHNYLYFNEDLSSWDVSNVTNMYSMFAGADNFTSDISSWDVSNVTDMAWMFSDADNFTGDLSSWDVSNVTDMSRMFLGADNFTSDLSTWDVSNVTDMSGMFSGADNFTSDLLSWDVSNVTDMSSMFYGADNFTSDLSSWDVSNVTDMVWMFSNADNFTGDLSSWDVSNVTDMGAMFSGADNFTGDLSSWDVSNVAYMSDMFSNSGMTPEDQCSTQETFSTSPYWPYFWECASEACPYDIYLEYNPYAINYNADLCLNIIVEGCTDNTAVNFNSDANVDDNSCNYIYGCTDSNADNYNPEATTDDGSCIYYGCTDPTAGNYDETANTDDGTCLIGGCMNFTAENFNPDAAVDDSSCVIYGCVLDFFPNYNSVATSDDGSCDLNSLDVFGCTDESTWTYQDFATIDNGTCDSSELKVGSLGLGGIVFYIDETGQHGLVAAMEDLGQYEWGCYETELSGAQGQAIGTGYQNTLDIVEGCSETNTAAFNALQTNIEDYTDWYLPSKDELLEMYSTIGQGSAEGNIGDFENYHYWSSSEMNNIFGWYVDFSGEWLTGDDHKTFQNRVRVIRSF